MDEGLPIVDLPGVFARHGSDAAYITRRGYRNYRVSYGEIAAAVVQFGHELAARQIGRGDRIVIWGENCEQWVIAFLGSVHCGAVPVPLDVFATPDFAVRVIREAQPVLAICSRRLVLLARGSMAACPNDSGTCNAADSAKPSRIATGQESLFDVPVMELERLRESVIRHPSTMSSVEGISRGDPLEIIFTSGTTSEPRGVVITYENIEANLGPFKAEIQKYQKYERFFHPIRFLNLVPLSHVFGQFMSIFIPPLLGGTVHFLNTLNPSEVLKTIRRDRISVLVTVPGVVESLRNKIERDVETSGHALTFRQHFDAAAGDGFLRRWWRFRRLHGQLGWKFWVVVCGGAPLDPETAVFWSRLGFVVSQGYGMTETASLISVNHPFASRPESLGKIMPGQEIKIDEHGEILVRGKNIAAGYFRRNHLEPVLGEDGWLHTGDLGEIDASGRLYFKGRKKRVIVTPEGMNIFPEDLEAALRRQAEVKDCVVTGIEIEGNSMPCAALILREQGADPAAAGERANASLAPYQRIRHWIHWPDEDFPRTALLKPRLGEIDRLVRETVGAIKANLDPSRDVVSSVAPPRLLPPVVQLIERVTGRKLQGSPGRELAADLNLSSLERVEILSAIEDRYQVEIDDSQFTESTTVRDLQRLIQGQAGSLADSGAAVPGSSSGESHQGKSGAPGFDVAASPEAPRGFTFPHWALSRPVNMLRAALYYLLIWPATTLLGKPRIIGRQNLRGRRGPFLIVSNHVFMVDPGYVMAVLPWRLRHRLAVAMDGELIESFHRPPVRFGLLRRIFERSKYYLITVIFNVFPLPQKAGFRSSFAYAGESVDRGYNVLVFPEGERTRTGEIAAFREGIGLLAGDLGIPVVPVRLSGLYQLKGRHIAPPHSVRVDIGPAVDFPPGMDHAAIARELERRVKSLGPKDG